ncbi:histidinol-phosphate transaminase [Candidatus Neomarinimicrobiota bacterium]
MALVPAYIKRLTPYKSGKSAEEVAQELGLKRVIKLASNENPLGPSPKALAAAQRAMEEGHRYPDQASHDLRAALAERFDLKIDNVITGAGSEGVMSAIMRTFLLDDDELISAKGSFIGFRVLADASGRTTHWVPMQDYRYDLESMADAVNDYTKIIYLANPDNPTGTYFTVPEFDAFMERVPERVLVILDEAYFEYAREKDDYPDSMHYRYDNVITLRTFSKVYGLAGLRVGYGFAHDELIGNLLKVKLPFEPSRPAQIAALAALEDEGHLAKSIQNNREGKPLLEEAFQRLGLETIPSAANFVTIKLPDEESAVNLADGLLQRGIIVRHLAAFDWPNLIRVTVGLPEENEFLISNLEGLLP